ncbi:MAG: DNA-binding response regulator, partial [Dermatophilaceae bacterium]
MERVPVVVHARDPISAAGVVSQLRYRPEVQVLRANEIDRARVAVVVVDGMDEDAVHLLRSVQRRGGCRTVLLASALEDGDLASAVEVG